MNKLFALLLLWPALASAQTVLTHLPVNQLLAQELLKGTEVTVNYLPPKRYGLSRLDNWFHDKVSPQQAQQWAAQADAIVGFSSLWSSDPLLPLLRQYNIRIVAIDSADPQHPTATKVAIRQNEQGNISPYVWLNPNNLKTMVNIVARDLSALYPANANTISNNQQALLKAVSTMEQSNQDWLFDNEVEEVIVVGNKLSDFVYGNNLYRVGHIGPTLDKWQPQHWQQLSALHDEGITLLLAKKPTQDAVAKLAELQVNWLLVDTVDKMGRGVSLARWQLK